MPTVKYSKQRECIREIVMASEAHPSADDVYAAVKEKFPSVSLATVYRNLTFLAEQGDIIKISTGKGMDRFDHNTEPHSHFVCKSCGTICDISIDNIPDVDKLASMDFEGNIEGHVLWFYGTCKQCRDK